MIALPQDNLVSAFLTQLAPSGALLEVARVAEAQRQLELELSHFDAVEAALQRHLAEATLVSRLEDDFAVMAQPFGDGVLALSGYFCPVLAAFAGPAAAPFVSFGLQVACKVAVAVLENWAKKRVAEIQVAAQKGTSP